MMHDDKVPGPQVLGAAAASSSESPGASPDAKGAQAEVEGTLDEPVRETIMRDVRSVASKLMYVMLPRVRADKAAGLMKWDLWGPLILCMCLASALSHRTADQEQAGLVFGLVFMIVWVGAGVVTLNAVLLRGHISFFQALSVLGYCICPLTLGALLIMVLPKNTALKVVLTVVGIAWSSAASLSFMGELVPEDKKALSLYPVVLFYVAIGVLILLD